MKYLHLHQGCCKIDQSVVLALESYDRVGPKNKDLIKIMICTPYIHNRSILVKVFF